MHNRMIHDAARARAAVRPALLLAAALSLAPAAAHAVPIGVTYAGVLKDGNIPVNDTVDVNIAIFSALNAGLVLYAEDDPGVLVVDGQLVIDIGRNGLDDSVLDAPELFLQISIDGEIMAPRTRLLSVPFALRTIRADKADIALVADALGTLAEADVVTQDQLVGLHLDQPLSAGAGIAIDAGKVSVAPSSVTSSMLAADAVDGASIRDGSVGTADLAPNAVGLGKIAPGAVTRTSIAGASVHKFVVARPSQCGGGVDVVSESACALGSNGIFCGYTCQTTTCRRSGGDTGYFDACANNNCTRTTPGVCAFSTSGGGSGAVVGGVAQFGVTVP